MPTPNMKKPGPEEPGCPGNPPPSLETQADHHTNQPIAGAGSFNFTASDPAVGHSAVPGSDTNTPNSPFSATYSNENAFGATNDGPFSPDRSTSLICAESSQVDASGVHPGDSVPGFAVPELARHLPDGEIVVDTGWTDAGGRQFRAVFCAGSQAPLLRSWIVDLMLAGGVPEIPEFPTVS